MTSSRDATISAVMPDSPERRPVGERVRRDVIGVAVATAIAGAAVLVIALQAPTAEAQDEPTGLQAISLVVLLCAVPCLLVFSVMLVVDIIRWMRRSGRATRWKSDGTHGF